MDINKLTYFFSAAEIGNFTQAADRCGIAQTTMSKYIRSLEEEVGFPLFQRNNKGCQLTSRGETFYRGMLSIYNTYQTLREQMNHVDERLLWIGVEGDQALIPEFNLFEEEYPEIQLAVLFDTRDELLAGLASGKLDAVLFLGFSYETVMKDQQFNVIELPSWEERLFCSKKAIERYGTIEKVIEELPFITKSNDSKYHDYCRDGLKSKFGVTFSKLSVADSISKQQMIVRLSQGFAIIPEIEIMDGSDFYSVSLDRMFITSRLLVYNRIVLKDDLKFLLDFTRKTHRKNLRKKPDAEKDSESNHKKG